MTPCTIWFPKPVFETHFYIAKEMEGEREREQEEPHLLLVEMQTGRATLEDSSMGSYKIKYNITIQFSNHVPWYLPRGVEYLCPHKNWHTDVYRSLINNCQN